MSKLSEFVAQKINQSDNNIIDYVTEAIAQDINFSLNSMIISDNADNSSFPKLHDLVKDDASFKNYKNDPRFSLAVYDSNDDEVLFLIKFEDDDYKVNLARVGNLVMPNAVKTASGSIANVMLFNTSPEDVCERMKQGFKQAFETDQIHVVDDGTMIIPRGLISTSGYMQVSLAFSFKYPTEDEYQTGLYI